MGVDGEEVAASRVAAGDDEVGADVTLVAEEVLLEHCHDGDDARAATGGEGVQLNVGGDESGGEFGVCSCAGASTPDLRSNVVELFTVLVVEKKKLVRGIRVYVCMCVCVCACVRDGVMARAVIVPCLLLWDR